MRFRTSGFNWEGRRWTLAPCLVVLAEQISALHPERHGADGTVASQRHDQTNPTSDHRPYPYTGAGVVRALDAGENHEDDAFQMVEAIRLSEDLRVKYVIHERRIFSSYPSGGYGPFEWRPYALNPHLDHLHISTNQASDKDTSLWTITLDDMPLTPEDIQKVARAVWADYPGAPPNQGGSSSYQTLIRTHANTVTIIGRLGDIETLDDGELQEIATAVADEIARRVID